MIFCKNCKFFKSFEDDLTCIRYCIYSICFERINTATKIEVKRIHDFEDLNKNNNCGYYKRKWHKFWIEQKDNINGDKIVENKKEIKVISEEQKREDLKALLSIRGIL